MKIYIDHQSPMSSKGVISNDNSVWLYAGLSASSVSSPRMFRGAMSSATSTAWISPLTSSGMAKMYFLLS